MLFDLDCWRLRFRLLFAEDEEEESTNEPVPDNMCGLLTFLADDEDDYIYIPF